jgi:hypothetical protein
MIIVKRTWVIFLAGLLVAGAAYFGFYYAGTAKVRTLQTSSDPELAWLKEEFHLGDAEFARISELHESYLAGCAERCRQIDEKNQHLKHLLAMTNTMTPEIERTLLESAQLRAECQKQMLEEFFKISRTMPPAQGERYLAWMQHQTILSDSHSQMQPAAPGMAMPGHR